MSQSDLYLHRYEYCIIVIASNFSLLLSFLISTLVYYWKEVLYVSISRRILRKIFKHKLSRQQTHQWLPNLIIVEQKSDDRTLQKFASKGLLTIIKGQLLEKFMLYCWDVNISFKQSQPFSQ